MRKTIISTAIAAAAIAGTVGVASPANASDFIICPSGHAGVIDGAYGSCSFAENVSRAYYGTGMSNTLYVDGQLMHCSPTVASFDAYPSRLAQECWGGENTGVVIW